MEDNKLNFNRPFLSVRRNSPAVTSQKDDKGKTGNSVPVRPHLPSYRSELKSGPIRNPGAVPFQWERTPGQPKEVSKQETRNHHRPPIAPKLPPGRCPQAIQQHSRQIIPEENSSLIVTFAGDSQSGLHGGENFKNFERYDEITEKGMHSESGDSDEDYVDAPDTLSRTESFFINCSVSGLSGFDDLDTEQPESFLTDPKSLEFMMDRFLPAAKAMASETPQCASQKESITREQLQQSKKIVGSGKLLLRYGPSFAKRYSYCHETEQEQEEDSDDDCNQHKKFPGVCGLLPRFCSRSSLGVLNAVPAMSMRTRVPIHAANTTLNRASSAGSYGETENESKPDYSDLKSMDTIQTSELEVNETNSGYEHFQVENHNASTSLHAPFSFIEEQEVTGVPEETNHTRINAKTFQELLADQGSSEESAAGEPAVEKSLYVDTMKMLETESTASCSPPTEEDAEGVPVSGEVLKIIANKVVRDVPEAYGENEDANLSSTMIKNLKVLDKDPSESQPPKANALENETHPNHSRLPVPPSLPKSPSDSWLGRTLPSISVKKSYLHSSFGVATNPKNHDPNAPKGNITWETFVKSTKELLTPIPEG
ncbi:uncharacterized protein [Primulina huaijiensis]|uniref:uncharacterized protein isoform X2 n=1 Tax=Primulina huaijiensis TaxID=1492673 RepID=UPI003CC70225